MTPALTRIDGRIFVETVAGRVELLPSSPDRTRMRYWRGVAADGRAVTPWLGSLKIAACWAVTTAVSAAP